MKKRSGEFLDGPGRFFVMLEVFRGRLFGLRYERLKRTLPVWPGAFLGLKNLRSDAAPYPLRLESDRLHCDGRGHAAVSGVGE